MECVNYPDMMFDMRPQVEIVRAPEERGSTILVFADKDGNWTMFALAAGVACVLARGEKWMMIDNGAE